MTLAQFHALPDDPAVDRMLLLGELVERPMTKRNRWHASCEAAIAGMLREWIRAQDPHPGKVFAGEVGCDMPTIDTGVGIDVAFVANDVLAAQDEDSKYIVGAPVLAVEILSLTDTVEDLHNKVKAYLKAGVRLVWVVDPYDQAVKVYRPGTPPVLLTSEQVLNANPELPGFSVTVSEMFE
jgi:Uma2 family endonuclease